MATKKYQLNKKDKWRSQQLDKHFKNKHTNPLCHGKRYQRLKKIRKKHARISVNQYTAHEAKHAGSNLRSRNLNHFSEDTINMDFTFHHDLKYLLSIKPDIFLGESVFVKYWDNHTGQFQGKLTCISQSGQYLLDDIVFRGGDDNNKWELIGSNALKKKKSHWFHLNCTQNIYINNCRCSSQFKFCECHNNDEKENENENDITYIITDIMKFKIVQYFLFICSFKTDNIIHSPLFYLLKENENKINIDKLLKSWIPSCEFAMTMARQFAYGTKQNEFDYLLKVKKKKQKQINIFLQPSELLELVNEYKNVLILYLQNKQDDNLDKDLAKPPKKPNNFTLSHHCWDESEIGKTVRRQTQENRTV